MLLICFLLYFNSPTSMKPKIGCQISSISVRLRQYNMECDSQDTNYSDVSLSFIFIKSLNPYCRIAKSSKYHQLQLISIFQNSNRKRTTLKGCFVHGISWYKYVVMDRRYIGFNCLTMRKLVDTVFRSIWFVKISFYSFVQVSNKIKFQRK